MIAVYKITFSAVCIKPIKAITFLQILSLRDLLPLFGV